MNGDEAFELELGRWLEEGPGRAPRESVATALARIRQHPERPRTLGSLWRHAMSGIGLTHVPTQPRRPWAFAVVVAAVVVVLAGGYGLFNLGWTGPGGQSPTPSAPPSAEPTSTPTPATGNVPAWTHQPGWATGTQVCDVRSSGEEATVEGVLQVRGSVYDCVTTTDDSRLTGSTVLVQHSDQLEDGTWLGWGTIETTNDGGSWVGTYSQSTTASAKSMDFYTTMTGSGDYDGLRAISHVLVNYAGGTYLDTRVLPVAPEIAGTETCTVAAESHAIGSDGVTHIRGGSLRCADTMSDPRVSGTRTLDFAIDERTGADGEVWGTATLANDDGTWEGFFFGTIGATDDVHRVQTLMRGTGAYEGLFFRLEVVGTGEPGYDLLGEILGTDSPGS